MARSKTIPNFNLYSVLLWIGGRDITNGFRGSCIPVQATFPEIRVLATLHGQDRVEAHAGVVGTVAITDQRLFDTLAEKYGANKAGVSLAALTFPSFASGEMDTLPRKAGGVWTFLEDSVVSGTIAAPEDLEDDLDVDVEVEEIDLGGDEPEEIEISGVEEASVKKTGR